MSVSVCIAPASGRNVRWRRRLVTAEDHGRGGSHHGEERRVLGALVRRHSCTFLGRRRRRPQKATTMFDWKKYRPFPGPNRQAWSWRDVKGAEQKGGSCCHQARRTGVAEENGETEKVTWPKASREHPSECEQVWTRGCPPRASTKHPKRLSLPCWRTFEERPLSNKGHFFPQQLCVGWSCVARGGNVGTVGDAASVCGIFCCKWDDCSWSLTTSHSTLTYELWRRIMWKLSLGRGFGLSLETNVNRCATQKQL